MKKLFKAIMISLLTTVLIQEHVQAACFESEHTTRIDYLVRRDLFAPYEGVVTKIPAVGDTYGAIFYDSEAILGARGQWGPQDPRQMLLPMSENIVARIESSGTRARREAASAQLDLSRHAASRGREMAKWQNRMRSEEDFIFSLQQEQNVEIRSSKEGPVQIRERTKEWGEGSSAFSGTDGSNYIKPRSVLIRSMYSDYMRAYELPQLVATVQAAEKTAESNLTLARMEEDFGKLTCPIQCRVTASFVREFQYVKEGERIASVISPYHKVARITLPSTHIYASFEPGTYSLSVEVVSQIPEFRLGNLRSLQRAVPPQLPISLKAMVLEPPVLSEDGKSMDFALLLRDQNGSREVDVAVLSPQTKIKVYPTDHASLSEDELKNIEDQISGTGRTCE